VFNIELDLPSGKKIRIPELCNRDYLVIIKFCENKDYYGLDNIFNKLFFTTDLDIIDRFFILIYVRMVFVGGELSLTSSKDINVKMKLGNILDNLIANYADRERQITHNNIHVCVGIPVGSYFNTIDQLYISAIKSVQLISDDRSVKVDFSTLTNEEKEEVLSQLPSEIFVKLQTYITELTNSVIDITLIEQNDAIGLTEAKVSILGNSIMYFICTIYSYDLIAFYETLYHYNHFVSNGSGDFFELTFNEVTLMLNMHAERIKKENEEARKREYK
jgi:energy-converting hydrogenase Eha subunit F